MKKFLIVGKISENEWMPVTLIYPELENFSASYESLEEAQRAKGRLKGLISSRPHLGKKVPYRIDEIE